MTLSAYSCPYCRCFCSRVEQQPGVHSETMARLIAMDADCYCDSCCSVFQVHTYRERHYSPYGHFGGMQEHVVEKHELVNVGSLGATHR